jgi:hypothetical protein
MYKNKTNIGVVGIACTASLLAALMIADFEFNSEWSQLITDVSYFAGLALLFTLLVFIGISLFKKDLKISAKHSMVAFKCALITNILILFLLNIANYLSYRNRDIESSFEPYYSLLVISWPVLPLVIISSLVAYKYFSQKLRVVSIIVVTSAAIMVISTALAGSVLV